MTQRTTPNQPHFRYARDHETTSSLLRQLLALSLPVMLENMLHMAVGVTDTYMANTLPGNSSAATAAVGTVSYFMWFVGLIVAAVGTGATAIIARAKAPATAHWPTAFAGNPSPPPPFSAFSSASSSTSPPRPW